MEESMRQPLLAAIARTGVVDDLEKAVMLANYVEADFKMVIDPYDRLQLQTRSGKPVDEELARVLERPNMQIFRGVPQTTGERVIGMVNQQRAEALAQGGPPGPLGNYQFARGKFNR